MSFKFIEFDSPVYSDAGLTTEITYTSDDGLLVTNSTQLPLLEVVSGIVQTKEVFYSAATYRATGYGRNEQGEKANSIYHVDFTYPGGVTDNLITTGTWDA